ncbi:hypothetical protein M4951_12360 [Blastopirellula sp. J2-11]|uniref:hypothetical protein n=1 Tax=Blastopirellula sp. J2-11 TaxID=2943192 RepID=UPI0021C5923A|nr:hypothetical protein [Blastopirellula sp. J2-11]UUO09078.1 hypothetical protein M4951_12360 [Blastopirellula sp. J2-11]
MGLNMLRLNFYGEAFNAQGARAFENLPAAVKAQEEMIRTNSKDTRIVITVYQSNYLNSQLTHLLKPGSNAEYDLDAIKMVRGSVPGVTPMGKLTVFDFVTVHQNNDLSVRFYETMDYGVSQNPNLTVKHKSALYSADIAGSIYIVTPIKEHIRTPLCPRGVK